MRVLLPDPPPGEFEEVLDRPESRSGVLDLDVGELANQIDWPT